MSTSDSDYSIDWLASDEDDYESPDRSSPQSTEPQPPPSSTTSSRGSPGNHHPSAGNHHPSAGNHHPSAGNHHPSAGNHHPSGPIRRTGDDRDSTDGDRRVDSRETLETPETPETPETLDTPETLETPETPETLATLETPETLETPLATPVQGFTYVGQQIPSWTFWTTSEHHQTRKRPVPGSGSGSGPGLDGRCEKPKPQDTEREIFSQKCVELQRYIQPLASILLGLRSGRYSARLSSFQESVAMDRIQRITGVLQNPNMGERFLSIILKIEEMLQSWFPHVNPQPVPLTEDRPPAKRLQSWFPHVKPHLPLTLTEDRPLAKRLQSWFPHVKPQPVPLTEDRPPAKRQKQHLSGATPPPPSPASLCCCGADRAPRAAASGLPPSCCSSSTRLKWLHTSPIGSLPTPDRPAASASPRPTRRDPDATQDNAVSSSTDSQTRPLLHHPRLRQGPPPPFKISSPCLERLLQAKESIIAPRTMGDGGEGGWLL